MPHPVTARRRAKSPETRHSAPEGIPLPGKTTLRKAVIMKKITKIISAALAALILASVILTGCSGTGSVFLKCGKTKITENMFVFWLSRYKAQFVYAYGNSIKSEYGVSTVNDFWEMIYDQGTGETYDDLFTDYIYENALTYLVSLRLFDDLGLSLSKEDTDEIDGYISELRDNYAGGSKTEFNVVLQEYGINEKTLRECYLIDKKISVLQKHLFGAGGPEAVTDAKIEAYYQENYIHFDQICVFINECPEISETGGYVTDSDGKIKYRDMSAAETVAARAKAEEAYAKAKAGSDFAGLVGEYNENTETAAYPDGIYMCSDQILYSGDDANRIFDTVSGMETGEVKMLELDNSIHILRRLPLTENAWKISSNQDFFLFYDSESSDYISLGEYIVTPLFLKYIEDKRKEYADSIEVDEAIRKNCKISKVKENYNF